jgi:hypothetical protein
MSLEKGGSSMEEILQMAEKETEELVFRHAPAQFFKFEYKKY